MATPRTAAAKKQPADPPLPAALAKRAKEAHASKLARLAAVGRAAIARVRERQGDIAASMVDIGLALHELRAEGVAEALGRKGFADVCAADLQLPLTTALNLVALATRVPRAVVTSLGPERARAVLELVDATPANDTPEAVLARPVKLPSGKLLDVRSAGVAEIREAAKAFRAARPDATTKPRLHRLARGEAGLQRLREAPPGAPRRGHHAARRRPRREGGEGADRGLPHGAGEAPRGAAQGAPGLTPRSQIRNRDYGCRNPSGCAAAGGRAGYRR
jgi:methylmalonyl-CoA mutase cobalamin-binding subunit